MKETQNSKGRTIRKVELPRDVEEDEVKAESARIFEAVWKECKANSTYIDLMAKHHEAYDSEPLPASDADIQAYLVPKEKAGG